MKFNEVNCFHCLYYEHLDPDTDYCSLHNFETYFDCCCSEFKDYKEGATKNV